MAYNAKKTEHAGPKKVLARITAAKASPRRPALAAAEKRQARALNPWHITSVNVRKTAGPVVFSANHGR